MYQYPLKIRDWPCCTRTYYFLVPPRTLVDGKLDFLEVENHCPPSPAPSSSAAQLVKDALGDALRPRPGRVGSAPSSSAATSSGASEGSARLRRDVPATVGLQALPGHVRRPARATRPGMLPGPTNAIINISCREYSLGPRNARKRFRAPGSRSGATTRRTRGRARSCSPRR
jgi:hypothetical protein